MGDKNLKINIKFLLVAVLVLFSVSLLVAVLCFFNQGKNFIEREEYLGKELKKEILMDEREEPKEINIDEAKTRALNFINKLNNDSVEVKSIIEEEDLYKMVIYSGGMEITSYMTKDGKNFFPAAMEVKEVKKPLEDIKEIDEMENQEIISEEKEQKDSASLVEKNSEEVKVELFVMAFCPYGVVAEKVMAPVYDLLKDKVDIDIRYIVSMPAGSNDINDVKSLHGKLEGGEDARQLCVRKYYGKDVLWDYITEIDNRCYPVYRSGEDIYNDCWELVFNNLGGDVEKIATCVEEEGAILIENNNIITGGYGVTGSPTLIINGTKIQATRTPEGFKKAICDTFEIPPAVCDTVLSSDGGTASGGC